MAGKLVMPIHHLPHSKHTTLRVASTLLPLSDYGLSEETARGGNTLYTSCLVSVLLSCFQKTPITQKTHIPTLQVRNLTRLVAFGTVIILLEARRHGIKSVFKSGSYNHVENFSVLNSY